MKSLGWIAASKKMLVIFTCKPSDRHLRVLAFDSHPAAASKRDHQELSFTFLEEGIFFQPYAVSLLKEIFTVKTQAETTITTKMEILLQQVDFLLWMAFSANSCCLATPAVCCWRGCSQMAAQLWDFKWLNFFAQLATHSWKAEGISWKEADELTAVVEIPKIA